MLPPQKSWEEMGSDFPVLEGNARMGKKNILLLFINQPLSLTLKDTLGKNCTLHVLLSPNVLLAPILFSFVCLYLEAMSY